MIIRDGSVKEGSVMAIFKKLDYWSINEGLDEIMDYAFNGNEKSSQYWDHYSELINDMSCIASDMWNELYELKGRLGGWEFDLPYKEIEFSDEDDSDQTAIAWFNTTACMLSDIDMVELLEHENIYDSDVLKEKEKRIKALGRLTKEKQMKLYTEVVGFIVRYLELRQAFDNIVSLINELDYHQSFVISRNGDIELSRAAYL